MKAMKFSNNKILAPRMNKEHLGLLPHDETTRPAELTDPAASSI